MKRGAWLLVTAVLVVLGVVTILVKRSTLPLSELRIGLILPLSGDAAVYGKSLQTGTDLAAREINTAGGVSGRQLRLAYEDTQADPKTAVSAFRKLLAVDRPALVIRDMFSHTTLAVAPIAQEEGIILLSPTASAQAIRKVGDHIFTIYPSDAYDGQFLAQCVRSHWPAATNIAVVYAQAEAMITCKDAFIASLKHPTSP